MSDKLIIEVDNGERDYRLVTRISQKANALLEDVVKRSGRSKAYIASKLIEYAYDHVEYDCEESEELVR